MENEEAKEWVPSDTFLAMMENTALCYVPVGTVFQLHFAPRYFFHCVRAFLDREFPDRWIGIGGTHSLSPFSRFDYSVCFILRVCKTRCFS
jgi:hypothetical protein